MVDILDANEGKRLVFTDDQDRGYVVTNMTPVELSQNASFQALLAAGLEIMSAQANVIRGMDIGERHAYADEARAVAAHLKKHAQLTERELPEAFISLSGLSRTEVNRLAQQMKALARDLNETFPQLTALDDRSKLELIREAVQRDQVAMETIAETADVAAATRALDLEALGICMHKCVVTFMALIAAELAALIAALTGCLALVIPPAVMACVALMITLYLAGTAAAQDFYDNCVANCQAMAR